MSGPLLYVPEAPFFEDGPSADSYGTVRWKDDISSNIPGAQQTESEPESTDDESLSRVNSQQPPLLSPGSTLNVAVETGLPPTPPSNSQSETPPANFGSPNRADGVVTALLSQKSSLSTPVHQRSPPTPDPSPKRTTESIRVPERPSAFTYPSSRAESFQTAREEPYSTECSRSNTPKADQLHILAKDRGLGLAFKSEDGDITPIKRSPSLTPRGQGTPAPEQRPQTPVEEGDIFPKEWDFSMMKNVTVRRKHRTKHKHEISDSLGKASPLNENTPRRSSSLRERVEASQHSPHTPSMETFAQSIGWPTEPNIEQKPQIRDVDLKRNSQDPEPKRQSGSSSGSTVVEAMVIVTPPREKKALRHTGRNLAYRRAASVDTSTDNSSTAYSKRSSMNSEDIPLHRLIYKRSPVPENRLSTATELDFPSRDDSPSPLYMRKSKLEYVPISALNRKMEKLIPQPVAEIKSKFPDLFDSPTWSHLKDQSSHKRIVSAPETTQKSNVRSNEPRPFLEFFKPDAPKDTVPVSAAVPRIEQTSPSTPRFRSQEAFAHASERDGEAIVPIEPQSPVDVETSLPYLPIHPPDRRMKHTPNASQAEMKGLPQSPTVSNSKTNLQGGPLLQEQKGTSPQAHAEKRRRPSLESVPIFRRSSLSARRPSDEGRRSSTSQDRLSPSGTEELPRHSYEWGLLHPDNHRKVSFDRSTVRTEEHALARHLYAQSTPFSQYSGTPVPLEISEATAVSIYPHNNHSLLVVQQVARRNTLPLEQHEALNKPAVPSSDIASALYSTDVKEQENQRKPTLTFEPSTPPMKHSTVVGVDSPLKNPRKPPEPPVIKFIPPTPAEELERQLAPGPPAQSEARPLRRLSLVQRARRYSDNLIPTLLSRASSTRGRSVSESHTGHPRVPSVNDEDGSLHPFWRPRGFWEGFDDSDSDDEKSSRSGNKREVVEVAAAPRLGLGVLGRRFTNTIKKSEGFLIGNSLGVERSGTNKRRPRIELPSRRSDSPRRPGSPPVKVIIQPPTLPTRPCSPRIEKRGSRGSVRTSSIYDRSRREGRRGSWRKGRTIPGLPTMQVQYIGLSGVKDRFREKRAEKRRDQIRQSIGHRYYTEPVDMSKGSALRA